MIKISADSTCDLSAELISQHGIEIIPLSIVAEEKAFRDGIDISPAEVIRFVDQEKKLCKTAAINIFEYQRRFESLCADAEALIHICISAEFSSCYQNALEAAKNLDNVFVVDSRNLSTGSGHIVLDAAILAEQGLPAADIVRILEGTIPRVEASFVIDRLDYLRKGGRCSALAAQSAKLLRLKPCIEVTQGKMNVGKKYRGSFESCLKHYVKDRLKGREDIDTSRIFITHCMCSAEIVSMVRKWVCQYQHFDEILETSAGCTVTNHCGPNTLGILFKRKSI